MTFGRRTCRFGSFADGKATRLELDWLADRGGGPLYQLEFVGAYKRHHRDQLDVLGPFHDLRQLVVLEVAR